MMSADHSAVDHLEPVRDQRALVQGLQYPLPEPGQRLASELAIDRRPLSEFLRQVTPRRTDACNPENPIQNKPMVHGFAPVQGSDRQVEALVKRPLNVRHQGSCQAGPHHRYQLESRSDRPVNPFCPTRPNRDQGVPRLQSVISSVGSGPDLDEAQGGNLGRRQAVSFASRLTGQGVRAGHGTSLPQRGDHPRQCAILAHELVEDGGKAMGESREE